MLDAKFIIDHVSLIKNCAKRRNIDADVDGVCLFYNKLKATKQSIEKKQALSNQIAKTIGRADPSDRAQLASEGKQLKNDIAQEKESAEELNKELQKALLTIPNLLPDDTPEGFTDNENVPIKKHLVPTQFNFHPKDHLELGELLDIIDFEGGAKVAGAKFYFLKNEGVLLENALKSLAFSIAAKRGYIPIKTPDLAKNEILQGAGYAPRGNESNTYCIEGHNLSLIATAEIAIAGLHANEIIPEQQLPIKYVAESHCFRTEAGGGGRESKGLYRVHQFSKIELFQFVKPEHNDTYLNELLSIEEEIYQALEIPYQVVRICAGDLGAPAYKKYDIEAWMPGKGTDGQYGEITSASDCTDFQARRLNTRYKDSETGKNQWVHTLNGTAIALSRTPIAILENFQQEDGSVIIPKALRPYMGVDTIKPKLNPAKTG
ncbi:MAG TPA: serine--tRNA ligase [Gammaproteobacteria bacterium]|nr:serine--tRNA ligase [Gammaproteobacteria bacterium]